MVPSQAPSELALVRAVLAGDAKAAARLIELASSTLWSATVRLAGDGKEGEAAFLHVVTALKADGWRQLRAFDGRSSLATYLALVARDVLADRLAKRFVEAPREAWMRFELFFGEDIRRRILRRFPREARSAAGDDLYQDVCLKLIEDDYRRVRSYDGRGSFSGYILTVVERVLIDLMRRDAPRRRLPAAIARLSALDQEVYAAIAWEKCPPEVERLAAALRGRLESAPDAAALREALARVAEAAGRDAGPVRTETVSLAVGEDGEELEVADSGPTPEEQMLLGEEERARSRLIAAVREAAAALPVDERLYLQIVFSATDPLPPREIAKQMGKAVEDVYRLRQWAQRWMADIASRLAKDVGKDLGKDTGKGFGKK